MRELIKLNLHGKFNQKTMLYGNATAKYCLIEAINWGFVTI